MSKEAEKIIADLLEKARNNIREEYDPEEDAYGDNQDSEHDGLSVRDSLNDDGEDEADKWLKEHGQKQKGVSNEKTSSDDQEDVGNDESATQDPVPVQDVPSSSEKGRKAQSKEKINDLDPDRLSALKGVAGHWLNQADQVKKLRADPRANPVLFAEGHRIAAHNAAHEGYNDAYQKFIGSDEYKAMSTTQKMRAEVKFKKEFQEKNPDHHLNAGSAVGAAHAMHDKAQDLHEKERNARIAHIQAGGQSGGETFSAEEAAQHVGGAEDEEGGHTASMVNDPAATFAAANADYISQMKKPKTKASEEDESLDAAEMKIARHPALSDPKNKKLLDDFVKEYHPLIARNAHRARSQAMSRGITEDKIDMGALHEAGLHGLMQAVHDYHPESGSTFKAHANGKMGGLMQSHLGSLDYIPKDIRAQAKAIKNGVIKPQPVQEQAEAPSEAPSEAVSTAAPKVSAKDVIASSGHPAAADIADRHARINTQRVVVRKKGV